MQSPADKPQASPRMLSIALAVRKRTGRGYAEGGPVAADPTNQEEALQEDTSEAPDHRHSLIQEALRKVRMQRSFVDEGPAEEEQLPETDALPELDEEEPAEANSRDHTIRTIFGNMRRMTGGR